MSEEKEVVESFEKQGIEQLFPWAGKTAFDRVYTDYDEPAGHDQSIVGSLAFKYLTNCFDRASSSGKYALPDAAMAHYGLDLLSDGISAEAFMSMPMLPPGLVSRSNFNGSPGWATPDLRWLLQSFTYGEVDKIKWAQKSPTKRRVARRHNPNDPNALFNFADYIEEDPLEDDLNFAGTTLILAHAFDRDSGAFELYLGRSRESADHLESPWYWRHRVAYGGPGISPDQQLETNPFLPGLPASSDVADLVVPLRTDKSRRELK